MWYLKFAPHLASAAAVALGLWYLNDTAYTRGKRYATDVCATETVPAAQLVMQERCEVLTKITEEENHAVSSDLARLRASYERLRSAKTKSTCVPLARPSRGDTGTDASPASSSGVGIHTDWLDAAFYDASLDIARGESCQRQLRKIYELNGKSIR